MSFVRSRFLVRVLSLAEAQVMRLRVSAAVERRSPARSIFHRSPYGNRPDAGEAIEGFLASEVEPSHVRSCA